MKSLFCLVMLSALTFGTLSAEPLALAELIDTALKNNPETEKAWWNAKRAAAVVGGAKSAYYPTVDLQANAAHGREVKFVNGPETVFTNYGADLCLNYLVYDFGERKAGVLAAKEALKAANWSSDFTLQRVVSQVEAHYYEYLNAQELLKTKTCSLQDAQLILEAAEELHRTGLRAATDLHTSKAAVAQIQMELSQQRAHVAIAYGKLVSTLGLSADTQLDIAPMPEEVRGAQPSDGVTQLIAVAEVQRADLLAKKALLGEMEARLSRAKKVYLPKLKAMGSGGWDEYTKHENSGYNYNVGLALDIPLFRGFDSIYRKRLASSDVEMTLAEIKELQVAIALEVLSYSAAVKAADESLGWSGTYLDEAKKSYEGSLENYKAGLQNIFDLIQAQRNLSDARMKQVQARTQWLVSLAQLAFATGSILK